MRLVLTSGPATIVQPHNIKLLDSKNFILLGEGVKVCQGEDEQVFLEGDFTGFHTYMIVTNTRFIVSQSNVGATTQMSFLAKISMQLEPDVHTSHTVNFLSPLCPLQYVRAVKMGRNFDAFELGLPGAKSERFLCDLSFMSRCRLPMLPLIPLNIEYIGIAATGERTAQKRLGEGHEKLQDLLARLHAKESDRAVSLVMYRPGKLDDSNWTFKETVEIFEACLIQHFRTKPLNVEHLDFPKNKTKLTDKLRSFGISEIEIELEAPKETALHSRHAPIPAATHRFIVPIPRV